MSGNLEKRITAKMVLDSTSFNENIKAVNKNIKLSESEIKLASEGIKTYGRDSEKLKTIQQALGSQVEASAKKVEIYRNKIQAQTESMEKNEKARDDLKKSVEELNKKYEKAVELYGKESAEAQKLGKEVESLEQQYKAKSSAVEDSKRKMQGYASELNAAESEMVKAQGQLNKITKELDTQNSKWTMAGEKLNQHAESLQKIGGNMTSVGDKLTSRVSVPLIGIGVAASKVGMDFEAQMSKVAAISGATGDDFNKLKNIAEEMGAKTRFSATESAQGLEFMAMAGWKTKEMVEGLPPILNLAIASGTELGRTSDIVTDALTAFGLKAKDAAEFSDVLAAASTNSNTNVEMMGQTFQYAAPVAGALSYSVQDTAIAIGLMANAGIKGEKAGTALRGGLTNLVNPTNKMADAMEAYSISLTNADGSMKPFRQVLEELRSSLGDLDEATQANVVSTIFGKEAMSGWLAVINASHQDFEKLEGAIDNCEGATAEMSATMEKNTKGSIMEMGNALETAGMKIFEVMAPSITTLANKVSEMATKFSELSPETQETIVKLAALAIATGPVIGGVGRITSGIGSFVGLAGKFSLKMGAMGAASSAAGTAATVASGGMAGLGTAIGGAAMAALPFVAGALAIGAAGIGIYKVMSKDVIPEVKLFGKETSEATKKAVGAYLELDEKAGESLMRLKLTSETVSEETKNALVEDFNQMGEQIKGGMDKHFEASLQSLNLFFEKSEALTAQEEADAIEKFKISHQEKIAKTESYTARVQEILTNASNENRALTELEQREINGIQKTMKENAIASLSENEVEAKAIMERMKQQADELSALQAVEVVKNIREQTEKGIELANKQYDETIKAIIKQRDEVGSITADQADKLIADANRQKDESIKNAEEMRAKVIEQAKAQAGEHVNEVDWEKGEVLSRWQYMNNETDRICKQMGKDIADWLDQTKSDIERDGKLFVEGWGKAWQETKSEFSAGYDALLKKSQEKWKEISDGFSKFGNDLVAGIKDIPAKMKQAGADIVNGLQEGLSAKYEAAKTAMHNLGVSMQNSFKRALDINSPSRKMKENGEFVVDGVVEGVENRKGAALKSMESLAKDMKSKLDKNIKGMNDLGKALVDGLKNQYNELERIQLQHSDYRYKNEREASEKRKRIYNDEHNEKLRLLDKEAYDKIKAIENKINGIDDTTKEEEKALRQSQQQKEIAELNKKVIEASSASERLSAQKELNEKLQAIEREKLLEERELKKESLRREIEAIRETNEKEKEEANNAYKAKIEQNENLLKDTTEKYQEEQTNIKNHYKALTDSTALELEARKLILNKKQTEIIGILKEYNPHWQDAGQTFAEKLMNGLNSQKMPLQKTIAEAFDFKPTVEAQKKNLEELEKKIEVLKDKDSGKGKAKGKVGGAIKALEELDDKVKGTEKEIKKFEKEADKSNKKMAKTAVDETARAIDAFENQTLAISKAMKNTSEIVETKSKEQKNTHIENADTQKRKVVDKYNQMRKDVDAKMVETKKSINNRWSESIKQTAINLGILDTNTGKDFAALYTTVDTKMGATKKSIVDNITTGNTEWEAKTKSMKEKTDERFPAIATNIESCFKKVKDSSTIGVKAITDWNAAKAEDKTVTFTTIFKEIRETVSNVVDGIKDKIGRNYTGTNYWKGGLTYLHDAPGRSNQYELYDLPRGTRVYNHDASQDMVLKTAESVATKVAEGMLNKMGRGSGIEVTQNIYSPTPTPSETARQTKNALRELALNW